MMRMNGCIRTGLAGVLALAGAVPAFGGMVIDSVVATVDNEPILQSDLMMEIAPLVESLRMAGTPDHEIDRQVEGALEEALETAIEQRILHRQAVLRGFQVDDEAVEERIDTIREQFPSNDAFLRALREAGETMSDFRDRMRRQIMAVSMGAGVRRDFEQEAVVTESDIAQYYQDNQREFSHGERIRMRRIFLDAGSTPEARETAHGRLAALKAELEQGVSFGDLARAHSEGPEAENGGVVGWVERGDLVPALEEILFGLATGGVSDPVDTEFGVQLLKADERSESGTMSLQEARTEIEPILRRKYAAERYDKWMSDLRKRSQVRVLL